MTDLLIPCLISAILGGAFVACLVMRVVRHLAAMATAAIRERDELREVAAELGISIGYLSDREHGRRQYADADAFEIRNLLAILKLERKDGNANDSGLA